MSPIQITDAEIKAVAYGSDLTASRLRVNGDWSLLAAWMLDDSKREKLRQTTRLPIATDPGCCRIPMVSKDWRENCWFAHGFALPFRWKSLRKEEVAAHEKDPFPFLPPKLRTVAGFVLDDLRHDTKVQASKWTLIPDFRNAFGEVVPYDFSQWETAEWESGYAALLGALYLAARGLSSRKYVWISAARQSATELKDVCGAMPKIAALKAVAPPDYGNQSVAFFIRTQEATGEAERHPAALPVYQLDRNTSDAVRTIEWLEPYLEMHAAPPVSEPQIYEELKPHAAYYQIAKLRDAEQHYIDFIAPQLAEHCRSELMLQKKPTSFGTLVCVLQPRVSAIVLALETFKPERLVLIMEATSDSRTIDRLQTALHTIKNYFNKSVTTLTVTGDLRENTHDAIQSQLVRMGIVRSDANRNEKEQETYSSKPPVAFDLTTGFRYLTHCLQDVAARDSWLLYCRHDRTPDSERERPDVLSSRYEVWQKPLL